MEFGKFKDAKNTIGRKFIPVGISAVLLTTAPLAGCSIFFDKNQEVSYDSEDQRRIEDNFYFSHGIGTFYPNERQLFDITHNENTTTIKTPEGYTIIISADDFRGAPSYEELYATEETNEVYEYKNVDRDNAEPYNSSNYKDIFYLFWGNPPAGLSDVYWDVDYNLPDEYKTDGLIYFKLDGVQYYISEYTVRQSYIECAESELSRQTNNYIKQYLDYTNEDFETDGSRRPNVAYWVIPVNYWEMARDKNGFYKDTNGQEHDEVYISRLNKNDGTPMPREQYTFSEWADRYSDLVESGAIEDPDYQAASDRTPQNKSNQNNPNPQANDETQPSQTQPEKNETEQPKSNIDVNKQERQAIFDKYGFELDRDSRVFIAGHFQYNVPMSSKYTYIDGYNGELSDPRGASFFYPNADAITVVEYWRATAKIKGGVFLDAWIRQNRDFADRHAEARPDCINLDIISGNDGFGNRLKPTGSDDERRTAEFDNGFVKCFYMEKRQFTYIYAQSNDVENGEAQCVAMIERFYDYLDDDEVKELYDAIIEEIAYSVRLYN